MDVVYLLPDQPIAPERKRLEALLPHLMERTILVRLISQERLAFGLIDDASRRQALEYACQFSNAAVLWIYDQVYVIGHQYVGYEFEGPSLLERGTNIDERTTASCLLEDRQSASDVSGQKMEGTG